jgi:hypothetical protein
VSSRREKQRRKPGRRPPEDTSATLFQRILNSETTAIVVRQVEWALFASMGLTVLWLNVELYHNSGAFWRDETSTIQIASAPSLGTLWSWLYRDSAPIVSYVAVRLWILAGLGATADGLRLFGTLVSLGIFVSLFISCRALGVRVPLLATSLVAFNVAICYYCSAVRGYGLAVLLIMPCCAAFWRLAQGPTRRNVVASLVLALLACHTSYQNSYLLFAIGLAGAGVCATCRLWRRAALILAICFVTAVSMLVYLPAISAYQSACQIQTRDLDLWSIVGDLGEALGGSSVFLRWAWILLTLCALACAVVQVVRRGVKRDSAVLADTGSGTAPDPAPANPSLPLYCLIVAAVAVVTCVGFLESRGVVPLPWHFTPLIAVAGMIVEAVFRSWRDNPVASIGRAAIACLLIAVSLPLLMGQAFVRRTNIDLVCDVLAKEAGPNDLILVNPFWLSPGFNYHYHGRARWNTLPLIPTDMSARTFPYASIKQLMTSANAIEATLEEIRNTLSAGDRVWVVEDVAFRPPGTEISVPPSPQPCSGCNCSPYVDSWAYQVGDFLRSHGRRIEVIPVTVAVGISGLEQLYMFVVGGWNDRPQGAQYSVRSEKSRPDGDSKPDSRPPP